MACVIATGVAFQGSGIFARPLISVETERPELALTFDDGPNAQVTLEILTLLEAEGHRATFFVVGERARDQPSLLREIPQRGHLLANHSLRHSFLTPFRRPQQLSEELEETSQIIARVVGNAPRWFRPPVGLLSPRVASAARRAALELVAWTASARDGVASRTVADAIRRLEPHLVRGAILVLHDGAMGNHASLAPAILKELLPRLRERGLTSVTLDQLLRSASDSHSAEARAS